MDLAWAATNRTGAAAVDEAGRLLASGCVGSDDDIASWLAALGTPPRVVAVDAPLIVPNATGQRVAERLIGQAYGRYGASAYPANRSNPLFDPPRAQTLAQRFGWHVDPEVAVTDGGTLCVEVYPHPALVGLFSLPQRVRYKKGPTRAAGFAQLADLLETIPQLRLAESPRWLEIRAIIAAPGRGDLDRIEDEIDAILCAHLAWLWHHRPDALVVYGSVSEGYIVAPPPPTHPALLRSSTTSATPDPDVAVVEVWGVRPGTAATTGGLLWATAIREATVDRDVLAPGARLELTVDFVLPPARSKNDQWDLDNLLKPTIDALATLLGRRRVTTAQPQADDERIDRIVASKRTAGTHAAVGARIELRVLAPRPAGSTGHAPR